MKAKDKKYIDRVVKRNQLEVARIKAEILALAEKYDSEERGGVMRGLIDEELAYIIAVKFHGRIYGKTKRT